MSSKLPVVSGVPQGSILLCVSIAVLSPYHLAVKSTCLQMTLHYSYHIITLAPSDYTMLQEDISAVSSFLNYKYLNFNEDKCCAMHITRKGPTPYLLHRYTSILLN